jgi:hypothetical protein
MGSCLEVSEQRRRTTDDNAKAPPVRVVQQKIQAAAPRPPQSSALEQPQPSSESLLDDVSETTPGKCKIAQNADRSLVLRIQEVSQGKHAPQVGMEPAEQPVGLPFLVFATQRTIEVCSVMVGAPRSGGEIEFRTRGDESRAEFIVLVAAKARVEAANARE